MANNVDVTPGSGITMGTDDVAGVHYPAVKLVDGTEDSATRIASGGGVEAAALRVTIASDSTGVLSVDDNGGVLSVDDNGGSLTVDVGAGENHIGEIGGRTVIITPTVTISTSIYAAGDTIGGKLTLTNAVRVTSGTGILHSIQVFDADNEKAAFDVLLFDADLAGTYTDNAAPTWNTADFAKFLGRVNVAATDYLTVNARAVATKSGINIPIAANGSRNLYAVLIATATPTYTATTDLTLRFGFLLD